MKRRSIRQGIICLLMVWLLAACDAFVLPPIDNVPTAAFESEVQIIAGAIKD